LRGGAGSVGQRGEEEEKKGEGEADRRGPSISVAVKKRKRRGGEVGRRGCWLTGRWAVWAERGAGEVFFFFFFFFKLHFQTIFLFKFKSNFFSNFFSRIFINFLETTQATKNHASQLMTHKHLLSLSLLNYIYYFRAQFK
jgi:hypothetical protein